MECGLEAERERRVDRFPVPARDRKRQMKLGAGQGVLRRDCPVALVVAAEPLRNPPGVAVVAPVEAARDWIPSAVAPLDFRFVHSLSSSKSVN